MTDKADILDAIRRMAEADGGSAPGRMRFTAETGITEAQWLGRYWVRWSDAIAEAGLEPNTFQGARPEQEIFATFVSLIEELGHFPTDAELKFRKRTDPSIPSHGVFQRFGNKAGLAALVIKQCGDDPALADVVAICEPIAAKAGKVPVPPTAGPGPQPGVVYLMKSGRHYKIGRSNSAGRRAYELAIQLPERLETVHVIETDDAIGIERYWHLRFAAQRLNGEWFALTAADVAAFKRRKRFM